MRILYRRDLVMTREGYHEGFYKDSNFDCVDDHSNDFEYGL